MAEAAGPKKEVPKPPPPPIKKVIIMGKVAGSLNGFYKTQFH